MKGKDPLLRPDIVVGLRSCLEDLPAGWLELKCGTCVFPGDFVEFKKDK